MRFTAISLLLFSLSPPFLTTFSSEKLPAQRVIEDFSESQEGEFPRGFRTYPFQRGRAMRVYTVQKEGENRYLTAVDSEEISVQILRKFYWPLQDYPSLSWRWRPRTLPQAADERNPERNDSACGVYVVFGGYGGKVLKYVWSTTLPPKTILEKKPQKFYIFIMGNGPPGSWQTVSVNVLGDYQKAFKEDPSRMPIGFGILTDGNATRSPAACNYDDFVVSR